MIDIETRESVLIDKRRPPAPRVRLYRSTILFAHFALMATAYVWFVAASRSESHPTTARLAGPAARNSLRASARVRTTPLSDSSLAEGRTGPVFPISLTTVITPPPSTRPKPESVSKLGTESVARQRRPRESPEPPRDPTLVLRANGLKRSSSIFILDDEAAAERMIEQIKATLGRLQPAAAWLERLDHARLEQDEMRKARHDAWIEAERLSLVIRQLPRPANNIAAAERDAVVQAELYCRTLVNNLDSQIRDAVRSMPLPAQIQQWQTTKSSKKSAFRDEVGQLRDLVGRIIARYEQLDHSDDVMTAIRGIPQTKLGPSDKFPGITRALAQLEQSAWLR